MCLPSQVKQFTGRVAQHFWFPGHSESSTHLGPEQEEDPGMSESK